MKKNGMALGILGAMAVAGCGGSEPAKDCAGAGRLCSVAGTTGLAGVDGDGGPALSARLYWPQDVTLGPDGEVFVVDFNNHRVRKIDAGGTISTFIGTGTLGDGNGGNASTVDLNHPTSLTIGPAGDLFLSAWHNWKIKIFDSETLDSATAIGSTQGFEGDGGPVADAKFDLPSSVVFDPAGNIFISDQGNQRIRRVDTAGMIDTFAGGGKGFADGIGAAAQFAFPRGPDAFPGGKIALGVDGDELFVADTENHRIRRIDLGTAEVTTVAGSGVADYSGDGGQAALATLNLPTDVAVGPDGSIYIADSRNHVIRRIDGAGVISTVAGTGESGHSPDGTLATEAKLQAPSGVSVGADGTLYIADTLNHQVKRVEQP